MLPRFAWSQPKTKYLSASRLDRWRSYAQIVGPYATVGALAVALTTLTFNRLDAREDRRARLVFRNAEFHWTDEDGNKALVFSAEVLNSGRTPAEDVRKATYFISIPAIHGEHYGDDQLQMRDQGLATSPAAPIPGNSSDDLVIVTMYRPENQPPEASTITSSLHDGLAPLMRPIVIYKDIYGKSHSTKGCFYFVQIPGAKNHAAPCEFGFSMR